MQTSIFQGSMCLGNTRCLLPKWLSTMCDLSQSLFLPLSVSEMGLEAFIHRFDFLIFQISGVLEFPRMLPLSQEENRQIVLSFLKHAVLPLASLNEAGFSLRTVCRSTVVTAGTSCLPALCTQSLLLMTDTRGFQRWALESTPNAERAWEFVNSPLPKPKAM